MVTWTLCNNYFKGWEAELSLRIYWQRVTRRGQAGLWLQVRSGKAALGVCIATIAPHIHERLFVKFMYNYFSRTPVIVWIAESAGTALAAKGTTSVARATMDVLATSGSSTWHHGTTSGSMHSISLAATAASTDGATPHNTTPILIQSCRVLGIEISTRISILSQVPWRQTQQQLITVWS